MASTLQRRVAGGLALGAALLPLVRRAAVGPRGFAPRAADSEIMRGALASDGDGWYACAAATPPATTCAVNASAVAFVQSVEGSDGTFVRSLVVQTSADIHNRYIFVGVRLGISVDVIDGKGITLATYTHEAFAGAWFGPQGNDRAYSWIDNTLMPEPRLNRIDHLRIRFANSG